MKGTYQNSGTLCILWDFNELYEADNGPMAGSAGFCLSLHTQRASTAPCGWEGQTLPAVSGKQPWGSPWEQGRQLPSSSSHPTPKSSLQIFLGGLMLLHLYKIAEARWEGRRIGMEDRPSFNGILSCRSVKIWPFIQSKTSSWKRTSILKSVCECWWWHYLSLTKTGNRSSVLWLVSR